MNSVVDLTGKVIRCPLPSPRPMLPRMAVASENQFPGSTFVPALAAGVRTQVHEAGPHARTVGGNQEVLKNAHVHFLRYNQLSDRAIM